MDEVGVIAGLFVTGMLLSAFFSGTETGFYRAARGRLVLDALSGSYVARGLIWLMNHPTVFVATTLVGNNVANYLVSLSLVLVSSYVLNSYEQWGEILLPLMFSPVAFVYGELFPKSLFYHMPNRLLYYAGPLVLLFTILFAPVSGALWLLGTVLQRLVGHTPLRVNLALARRELHQMIEEGQEAGVLRAAQRGLAQNLITSGSLPVRRFTRPLSQVASVRIGSRSEDALRAARRAHSPVLLVRSGDQSEILGYVRAVELLVSGSTSVPAGRTLPIVADDEPYAAALIHLHTRGDELVGVANKSGEIYGVLRADDLYGPLFGSS